MVNQRAERSQRLAWLEGVRILSVVMLLLYHVQLRFTGYAYTPQPTGLVDNLNQLIAVTEELPGQGSWMQLLALPAWFGFQFVDVLVLVSGFSLVLSLQGKYLEVGQFLHRRLSRILIPFWTVVWLAVPLLWTIAVATGSRLPEPWYLFAGITYPLTFSYDSELLVGTSGPWWLMSLILSFAVISPWLWKLMQRWGGINLLLLSTILTISYRALAVYGLGGHPTSVIWDSAAGWHPFALFLAKLSTFVLGMVVGQAFTRRRGPVYWPARKALITGIGVYAIGFFCQFYLWGWVLSDLLLPIGLGLCIMVALRALANQPMAAATMVTLGTYTYTYFLLHGLVADRILQLIVQGDPTRYVLMLPVIVGGTLILAMVVEYISPLIRRIVVGLARDLDYVLATTPTLPQRFWNPQVGDQVRYRGEAGWTVLKVEKLLDEREFFLCQVSDGRQSLWANEDDLEPIGQRLS
ncbi:MAG: hypothetical protein OHK0047_23680 [Leptolyngbyaceae cyanobacterium]